ncbi:tetratricopeptide repeat protein [Brachyspira catarrhinii]|uniref:Tetratricopeptide repeat protein n=1 Tax=Brachyspira catarrhinii TaxID=2528966 RepID=A0ABY2TS84_9SPIR|nr:tetratricopeptide repeat protein [Brachyspira catarrhinii]TKZ35644.1 tetratricopeptide repeat protein [Brachyspira catarrhinii]
MSNNILENEINITEIIKEVEIQKKEIIIDKINNFLDINNFEYAKKLAEELIKKEPQYKEAYLVLSDIYYEEENYKAVIDILNKGLNYINNDKDLLENKIEALTSLYKYDEAKATINGLINLGNADSSIYGQFGVILSMEGKYKEALEQYKKAISLNYGDIASMINMSITYKAMYLYDDAINILERALTVKKDNNILNRINDLKSIKEKTNFYAGRLIPIRANPDRFNLLVPENFNAKIENGILKIENENNSISIMISYESLKENLKNEEINNIFNDFKIKCGELYSIVSPLSIENRKEYNDTFASTIFTSKIKDNYTFNAMAMAIKNKESIILTLSSSVYISNYLIAFAKNIINSLYFK